MVSERNVLPPGSANLSFVGGELVAPGLARTLSIAAKNKVSVVDPGAEQLRISLKPTGEWSATFIHPLNGKRTSAGGVVLRNKNEARGFFLGPNSSGHALIESSP